VITGSSGGLGLSATMALANRPEGGAARLAAHRPPRNALAGVAAEATAAAASAREIG
jgi:NAD(P)-dependent dehydrogenase (short-subunit alcohol dehydrogenase family)